jgi:hypothetical protein
LPGEGGNSYLIAEWHLSKVTLVHRAFYLIQFDGELYSPANVIINNCRYRVICADYPNGRIDVAGAIAVHRGCACRKKKEQPKDRAGND